MIHYKGPTQSISSPLRLSFSSLSTLDMFGWRSSKDCMCFFLGLFFFLLRFRLLQPLRCCKNSSD
ncbi:hypothetical protein MANES_02G207601v8 [Manihot esculenta]|uniref:Uncharacterized protein n=1 Tax=Manihot esculenta TaxID=3983 RepID=A0ACB7I9J1_MANES|nr:hypothetical protein MANES_02G207601v8 [Manihot esculenta]